MTVVVPLDKKTKPNSVLLNLIISIGEKAFDNVLCLLVIKKNLSILEMGGILLISLRVSTKKLTANTIFK